MKRSVLTTLSAVAFVLPLGLAACNVESTENNTINGGAGTAGTGAKGGAAGASAGAAGTAGAAAGAAGAAAGSAGAAGAAAGSAGAAGGDAGAAGAAAGSAGAAGAAAGAAGAAGAAAGAGGAAAGAGGAAAGAGGAAAGAGGAAAGAGGAAAGAAGAGGSGPAPDAHIRFAHLFNSANPLLNVAIDVCIQDASETSWTGYTPFFFDNDSAGKFSFTRVSVLAALESGAKRIRPVLGSAQNCDTALPTVADILVTIPANAVGTFAIMGTATPTADFFPDTAPFTGAEVSINGIHGNGAVLAAVAFGLGNGDEADKLLENDVPQFKAYGAGNKLAPSAGNGVFVVSNTAGTERLGEFIDNQVLLGGERYNVFFTAPSTGSSKNNLIVCSVATPAEELLITPDADLGKAISTLCTTQAN